MTPRSEIAARLARATPGPWQCLDTPDAPFDGGFRVLGQSRPLPDGVVWQADNRPMPLFSYRYEDAVFAAHSHKDISDLLCEIAELEAKVAGLREALQDGESLCDDLLADIAGDGHKRDEWIATLTGRLLKERWYIRAALTGTSDTGEAG